MWRVEIGDWRLEIGDWELAGLSIGIGAPWLEWGARAAVMSAEDALEPVADRQRASLVRTVLAAVYLLFGSGLFATLSIASAWLPRGGDWVFFWARCWSRGWLAAAGVRLSVSSEVPLSRPDNYVFMANHQSALDIPVLLASLPVSTRFMAKRELFRIPVFGWAIRAGGFIPVDRRDRASARQSFQAAIARLRGGASVFVFPEETRSTDGTLLPFQRGGFLLAMKSGTPIVPVGVVGTSRVQRRGGLLVHPGPVEVRYGRPVAIGGARVGGKADFIAEVRQEIERLLAPPASH
jgi:1-acyl-sn-glycerol-3-phosphate acyltransferase